MNIDPVDFSTGHYRIEVEGSLDHAWFDRLGAMRVLKTAAGHKSDCTVLQGQVRDQAELSGILTTLYELHLRLLSVKYLGESVERASEPGRC